uniref:CSON001818 protein n=1 Tax=Culicoides sonorensis TaxID=179676 RepID=A0A336K6W5_CULSO
MAKRGATQEINRDNWDEEIETESAGTFSRASKEELQKRVIKKAVRRVTGASGDGKSAFSGFAGFGAVQAKPPASTFSFLAKTPAVTTQAEVKKDDTTNGVDTYSADIKKLNNEFAKWIQKCLDKNPLCILTPIFDDYKKYLKEIEEEKNKKQQNSTVASILSAPISFGSTTQKPSNTETAPKEDKTVPELPSNASSFKFGDALTSNSAPKSETSTFSFGNTKTDSAAKFSFGSSATLTSSTTTTTTSSDKPAFTGFGGGLGSKPFSFGSSAPFSFGNVGASTDNGKKEETTEAGDDEDEPPKVEFTPVVEEDSLYSKRCKVFVKVDKEFKDRGVGTLYVKDVEDGAKTQVIVRADTSLGNLLLNMLLTKETPTSRMGKNNVMVGTVVDGKPTSVLIRVKTGEDADEVLDTLEKYKK